MELLPAVDDMPPHGVLYTFGVYIHMYIYMCIYIHIHIYVYRNLQMWQYSMYEAMADIYHQQCVSTLHVYTCVYIYTYMYMVQPRRDLKVLVVRALTCRCCELLYSLWEARGKRSSMPTPRLLR